MNKKPSFQILEDLAREDLRTDLNLTPQIIARVQKGKGAKMKPRIKLLVSVFVILLVLVIVLVNVPTVMAAIQRWFGYVPGFGLVHEGPLRELAEPASLTQGQVTLRVDQALLSDEKTQISYTLLGAGDGLTVSEEHLCPGVQNRPLLRLPDGRELELRGNGLHIDLPSYVGDITYTSIPAEVNSATLIINCLENSLPERVPQHWEIPLRFAPASTALSVAPVLEAPPTVEATGLPTVPGSGPTAQPVVFKDGLVLKNVIKTADGVILTGTIMLVPPHGYTIEEMDGYLEDVTITDASGQNLQFGIAPDDFIPSLHASLPENTYAWATQVYAERIHWPLTMTVHSLAAQGANYPQAQFLLDVGPAPQPNQIWKLDLDLPLGDKTAHVVSVRRIQGEHGLNGYEFILRSDPSFYFSPEIQGHQTIGGGGSGTVENGVYTSFLAYGEPVPSGKLTVLLNGFEVTKLPGPWQVTWQEPK